MVKTKTEQNHAPAEFTDRERRNFRPQKARTAPPSPRRRNGLFVTCHNRLIWKGMEIIRGQMYGVFNGVPYITNGETVKIEKQPGRFIRVVKLSSYKNMERWEEAAITVDCTLAKCIQESLSYNPYASVEYPEETTDCSGSEPYFPTFQNTRPDYKPRLPKTVDVKTYVDRIINETKK